MTSIALALVLASIAEMATAQGNFPNRPIRLIVPYPPGGTSTTFARLIGQKMTEGWGQNVIIDNRPGGNTIVGTESLVRAAPSGYTIMFIDSTHVINPSLIPYLPYVAIKDFTPVATLGTTDLMLTVHPSVPAATLQEFIALARSRPGQINYASSGTGTVGQLSSELLSLNAKIKLVHVPHKGAAAALISVVGGHMHMYFAAPISAIPHIVNGKLKPIAVPREQRLTALPNVPTFAESGMPGFSSRNWYGVLAPAGTPRAIVDKLATEIARILALSDVTQRLTSMGMDPYISTPDQFTAMMHADLVKFAKIIKDAGIKPED